MKRPFSKKPKRGSDAERAEALIEDVTARAQKDAEGKPILTFSYRPFRSGASASMRARTFASKMTVPKGKKKKR